MIKILDICSGIGGFSLGLEATGGFDTVAFCEFDDFCCKVLNKHWPDVPIYKDLKEIGNDPERIIQEFDLICGGIPCQPFSLAGKQKGKEDDRHLWPYMYAIVKSKKPTWVIVENVGGFVNVALDDVCLDLETQGYATQSFIIPACSVEAPHKRDRIWILGKYTSEFEKPLVDTDSIRPHEHKTTEEESSRRGSETSTTTTSNDVANAQSNGEDGVLRTTESEHDQGDTRMESSSSSDRRSERGIAQDVANSKELRNYEHDNGERTQQDREHRVSQQPGGEGSLGGTEDVADSKLVSSDSISDSGSNTKTESEQGQKTGNLDRSSGRQDVAHSNSEGLQGSEEAGDTQKSREEREQLASGQDSSLSKWNTKPGVGGVADGIPTRLDGHLGFEQEPNIPRVATGIPDRVNRLKALGNSIVPQIVYNIGLAILEEEKRTNVTK
jgi:DNA (cytosine-5)-methyltransferase 1